jgi:hypothetical protein
LGLFNLNKMQEKRLDINGIELQDGDAVAYRDSYYNATLVGTLKMYFKSVLLTPNAGQTTKSGSHCKLPIRMRLPFVSKKVKKI